MKARLEGDRQELKKIEVRADALVSEIRSMLDPYADSVCELKTGRALVLIHDLERQRERAVFIAHKIREYEEALNG